MAGAAVHRRLTWTVARVVELIEENPTTRSIVFEVPGWEGHIPGQHLDLRLSDGEGYQAQRSYSIATPEDGERITITVELVNGGEVSPFLIDELRQGDGIELRGPIGGYFVWSPASSDPLFLVGGGSGVVPLMAMMRARRRARSTTPVHYLASARSADRLLYFDELTESARDDPGTTVLHTLTRSHPDDWEGPTRRIDREMLSPPGFEAGSEPDIFVCGPTGFVESVSQLMVEIGHSPEKVKTERFGPSGDQR
jgi:ferredoxin-NADP reductase